MSKDYRLQIKVKNAPMLRAMDAAGFKSAAQLSRACYVRQSNVGHYLNLKRAPYVNGELRADIEKIMFVLKATAEDLFPPQHLCEPMKKSSAEVEVSLEEIDNVLSLTSDRDIDFALDAKMLTEKLFDGMNPRNREIIKRRYGINSGCPETLDDLANDFGVSQERIRQIEGKGIRKMKDKLTSITATDRLKV